jgi:hypothetical protein
MMDDLLYHNYVGHYALSEAYLMYTFLELVIPHLQMIDRHFTGRHFDNSCD